MNNTKRQIKKFHLLVLNKEGNSDLECHSCGSDAKYISFNSFVPVESGKYFCEACKEKYSKIKVCQRCGQDLKTYTE